MLNIRAREKNQQAKGWKQAIIKPNDIFWCPSFDSQVLISNSEKFEINSESGTSLFPMADDDPKIVIPKQRSDLIIRSTWPRQNLTMVLHLF